MNKPAIALIVVAAAGAGAFALDPSPRTSVAPTQVAPPAVDSAALRLPGGLPQRGSLPGKRADVFAPASWSQIQPKPPAAKEPESAAAGVSAPPMPYKFVGTVTYGAKVEYILTKGDALLSIKQGDTLDGAYRVEAISRETVTLNYLPLEERTTLVLTAPAHEPTFAANSGTQSSSFSPLAPQSSTPQASAPSSAPGMRAAQLRGPRNVAQ